jgi:hypothetical protein
MALPSSRPQEFACSDFTLGTCIGRKPIISKPYMSYTCMLSGRLSGMLSKPIHLHAYSHINCIAGGAFGRVYQAQIHLPNFADIIAVKELSTAGSKPKDLSRKVPSQHATGLPGLDCIGMAKSGLYISCSYVFTGLTHARSTYSSRPTNFDPKAACWPSAAIATLRNFMGFVWRHRRSTS